MRLIDVDKVIIAMQECLDAEPDKKDSVGYFAFESIIGCLKKEPTVDAVEVVRCRQCKHCDPENHHCDHYMGTVAPLRREPEDFCSYGERKDVDGNG